MNTRIAQTKTTIYPVNFTVVGSSRFPLDMLRYDRAFPATEHDAALIAGTLAPGLVGAMSINLIGYFPNKLAEYGGHPQEARWQSFGWRVVKVEGRDYR